MKNKLLLLGIVLSLSVLPVVSFAETNASTTKNKIDTEKRETIKDEIEAKKEALKKEVEQKRESIKNSIEERRQNATDKIKERVDQFVQNMKERFNAAVNRLDILANRIDSRIAKMEAEKIDVVKAKELMVIARAKIEIARTSITDIASTTSSTSLASTTKESLKKDFEIVKTQIEKARERAKEAHEALINVVENLKPGQHKEEKETKGSSATSTATTTKSED